MFGRVLLVVGMLVLAASAAGQDASTQDRLGEVEKAIEKTKRDRTRAEREAENLRAEIAALRDQSVAVVRKARAFEADMLEIQDRMADLSREESTLRNALRDRRGQFIQVLTALQSIARHPPEALLVHPTGPSDMVRGAILLRAAVPEIERRAWRLREDLEELRDTRTKIRSEREKLARASRGLEKERAKLDAVMTAKTTLRAKAELKIRSAERRVGALAREAKDLRDLMQRLEQERLDREAEERKRAEMSAKAAAAEAKRKEKTAPMAAKTVSPPASPASPPPPKPVARPASVPDEPISRSRGRLIFPAIGTVTGNYGQRLDTGLTRKGVDVRTRSEAPVVAPFGGRVAFAGPFRGYGLLLIIEHGEGYHSLLAGMARLDATLGQMVVAGEPVGRMGQSDTGNPILYVELRRNGQPINPLPWLAAHKGGESG